jgi:hypothetical protein
MTDYTHLDALINRLLREKDRLLNARSTKEIAFRNHQIAMCEKEIAGEMKFLGLDEIYDDISDDDLLKELFS